MSLSRISRNFAQLGFLNGLVYLAGKALSRASGGRIRVTRYALVAQPVPTQQRAAPRPSPRSPVDFITADDPVVTDFPRRPAVIARRFAQGDRCLAARVDGRFAGFIWLARNAYDEDTVRCRYEIAAPHSGVWDYDVYVDPDFRLGRTFARLWSTANARLAAEGVHWSFSRIDTANPVSLQAHRQLGIRKLYSATFVTLGGCQLMLAGAAPYVHVALTRGARPVLRLHPPAR